MQVLEGKTAAGSAAAVPAPAARMEEFGYAGGAVEASGDAVWLLATTTLIAEHDMGVAMPATAEEFVAVMTAGERKAFTGADEEGLTCTAPQRAELNKLISAFNAAGDAQARFELLGRFMVEAVALEGAAAQTVDGKEYRVTRYDMFHGSDAASKAFFAEDYPLGDKAHGMTLALGVMRWCRFSAKLLELKAERGFASAAERNAALSAALG